MKNGRRVFELLCTAVFAVSCFFSCTTEASDNGGQENNPTTASYKVEHYQQKVSGSEYDLVSKDTQTLTGTIGEKTAAKAKTYTGFTAKSFEQENVAADGKTVVKIYYDRNTITLTINLDGGTASGVTDGKLTGRYGAQVPSVTPVRENYEFLGWNNANGKLPETFTENKTYKALWTKNLANYTVKHLLQNVDGNGYTEDTNARQTLRAEAGAQTEAASITYEGFTAQTFSQATVAADGTTVIEINYNRNTITLTFGFDPSILTTEPALTDGKLTGLYGAPVIINAVPADSDYNFLGWSPALPETFPAENAAFTAVCISSSMTGAVINVTIQENPEIEVLSAVQSTGKVTFTAEDGFTNYKWYVNGFNGVQGTSRVFELNTANLSGGTYTVTVRAEKNGITFSASSYVELDKTAPARVSNLRVTS
ncbi:MAG: InlB B-repeat-containing protein, partial [Treponema sp.]|nr:InlB B-repeat-containing protein [Treponema sp.]